MNNCRDIIIGVVCIVFANGCDQKPHQDSQVVTTSIKKREQDVSNIVLNVAELQEEKLCFVTFKFQKQEYTLDLLEHAVNAMTADYRTLVVDERAFKEYQIGQQISSVFDGWGMVFNGEISKYTITVSEKEIKSQYFWSDQNGIQTEIDKAQYNKTLQQLHSSLCELLSVPSANVIRTYILNKPFDDYHFVAFQPLMRYFMTIRVENSTLTLDIAKHIRNAATAHEITIEIPQDIYETIDDVWEAKLNGGALLLKGHLSNLSGKVIKKWSELDNSFQIALTDDGQQFIIPL